MSDPATRWADLLAAAAIVRAGGGVLLVRDAGAATVDALLAAAVRWRRLPADADPAALAGGIDALASLAAGRVVATPPFVARMGEDALVADAGLLPGPLAHWLAGAIDAGAVRRVILFAADAVPAALADRADMIVDAAGLRPAASPDPVARRRVSGDLAAACAEGAARLGVASLRPAIAAARIARAAAAIAGDTVCDADLALAARLALAPRATVAPDPAADAEPEEPDGATHAGEAADTVVAAARAVPPPEIALPAASRGRGGGASPARRGTAARGRGGRVRRGRPAGGARLDLAATLIAAAPFQRLRGRDGGRPIVRAADLRTRAPRPAARTLTIFAVDASGSAALARLAEVKGAVEALLARGYARRDEAALIAFRGDGATLLLPPTRALARARRELMALPGGGATPLAAGILAALDQAVCARAADRAPHILLLTDGGGNVARDGTRGRAAGQADAAAAARAVAHAGIDATVIDSSRRGEQAARALAAAMAARYVALPHADEAALARIAAA